jgi:hypothetical protein
VAETSAHSGASIAPSLGATFEQSSRPRTELGHIHGNGDIFLCTLPFAACRRARFLDLWRSPSRTLGKIMARQPS